MTNTELEQEIKSIVAMILESPSEDIDPDADFFKDLGMDSLKAIEITGAIEKKFKIIIPEERIRNIKTINQAVELASQLLVV